MIYSIIYRWFNSAAKSSASTQTILPPSAPILSTNSAHQQFYPEVPSSSELVAPSKTQPHSVSFSSHVPTTKTPPLSILSPSLNQYTPLSTPSTIHLYCPPVTPVSISSLSISVTKNSMSRLNILPASRLRSLSTAFLNTMRVVPADLMITVFVSNSISTPVSSAISIQTHSSP